MGAQLEVQNSSFPKPSIKLIRNILPPCPTKGPETVIRDPNWSSQWS